MEAVEYVVRPSGLKRWAVWMVELDASVEPARFKNSSCCSVHNSRAIADKKAAAMRVKDEVHISKVRAAP